MILTVLKDVVYQLRILLQLLI